MKRLMMTLVMLVLVTSICSAVNFKKWALGAGMNYQSFQIRSLQNGYEFQLRFEEPKQLGLCATRTIFSKGRVTTYFGGGLYATNPGTSLTVILVGVEISIYKGLAIALEPTMSLWDQTLPVSTCGLLNINYYF
jgi:hypothetical protein